MTDRSEAKRKERARKAAGYTFISGYTDTATAPEIERQLITAAEVDKRIEEKGKEDVE